VNCRLAGVNDVRVCMTGLNSCLQSLHGWHINESTDARRVADCGLQCPGSCGCALLLKLLCC
jgi:hypothetical protein